MHLRSDDSYTEDGYGGILKIAGQPVLAAYEPALWRFARMLRILGAAKVIAARADTSEADRVAAAIISISDVEGEFRLEWDRSAHRPHYEAAFAEALALEGEDWIAHSFADAAS